MRRTVLEVGGGLAGACWTLGMLFAIYPINLLWLSETVAVRFPHENKEFLALHGVYTLFMGPI